MAAVIATGMLCGCRPVIDRLIFFPDPIVGDPPPGVTERSLKTDDGVLLHAWYAGSPRAETTLVWSHGNAGNIAWRADVLLALAARGVNVLAYDYRGYGRSKGRPSEAGVYRDAEAALDSELATGVSASRIVCFGESLGGAVSIRLASRRPCAAVIVVSAFTSLRDVARFHYGSLAVLTGARFDSAALVGKLGVPFLAVHGDRDTIVPYELGERLFRMAAEPKRFLAVAGAGHNDIFEDRSVLDAIAHFAREHARD